jgi:hypothetical protein
VSRALVPVIGLLVVVAEPTAREPERAPLPAEAQASGREAGQRVWVRFTPAWHVALSRFGLEGVRAPVEDAVLARLATIHRGYAVSFDRSAPRHLAPGSYPVIELLDLDPNGVGLFGYDSSGPKDVGDRRRGDVVGGPARPRGDGLPGFGGIFVGSHCWWSMRPCAAGARPVLAPLTDPLFDEIFDPVRRVHASAAEWSGAGTPRRVAQVRRAVLALAAMVGEGAAHEFGHTLGLAAPHGPAGQWHDPGDEPGCLMERSEARPFGERAAQRGFAPTRHCHDAPGYLRAVFQP